MRRMPTNQCNGIFLALPGAGFSRNRAIAQVDATLLFELRQGRRHDVASGLAERQ